MHAIPGHSEIFLAEAPAPGTQRRVTRTELGSDRKSGGFDELWTGLGRPSRGRGPESRETKTADPAAGADIWPELWFERSSSRHQETRPEWKALPRAVNYIYMFSPLCCGRRSAS